MINVINIFLTNSFKEKKCDVLVKILPSIERSKVLFPIIFLDKQNG